jgi:hypothetical protein
MPASYLIAIRVNGNWVATTSAHVNGSPAKAGLQLVKMLADADFQQNLRMGTFDLPIATP